MNRPILVLLILLLTASCSNKDKVPGNILSPIIMQEVMWDMIRADEFVSGFIWKNDSAINRQTESIQLYEKIFQIHRITKEQFQKSLIFYRAHPGFLKIIVDSLNAKSNSVIRQVPVKLTKDSGLFRKYEMQIQ